MDLTLSMLCCNSVLQTEVWSTTVAGRRLLTLDVLLYGACLQDATLCDM